MRTEQLQTVRAQRGDAGYSLVELLVSMGITVVIVGTTMMAMNNALRAAETAQMVTSVNGTLRTSMDLMVRDLLQVAAGLPPGHTLSIPSGANSARVLLPGPPIGNDGADTDFETEDTATTLSAVIPGPGLGPVVNGVATDIVTVLMADNTFGDVAITAATSTTVDVTAAVNIATGVDRIVPGQLMMVEKGSTALLLQVTAVDTGNRRLSFDDTDSLNLNQPIAAAGSLAALNAQAPANTPSAVSLTRVRMISYYIDARNPDHPRLVRRVNNGHPTDFDNTLGTAVAVDVENLQVSYDLADANANASNVRFVAADLTTSGACNPVACSVNQIRKMNITLTGRSQRPATVSREYFRNAVSTQVSLRGMAFVDEYFQ
jgi:type II secretory pathway pseudopilin PulG